MEMIQKKLHFISYSHLYKWDAKFYLTNETIFNPKFKQVLFGDFLSKASIEKVKILDEEKYKILGVRSYGKGVFLNRESLGKDLKMKEYYKAKPNHLFWCKVDTKNGAFGVVNDKLADGFGSSNMTFAEIDTNKINVDFLQLLFTSKKIHSYLDSFVTGTTNRKYIRPDQLLEEIRIPLPTIQEQQIIVDAYFAKINKANQLEVEAKNINQEIEKYLFDELGLSKNVEHQKSSKILKTISFNKIDRWAIDYLSKFSKLNFLDSGKYNLVKLKEVIDSYQYGLSEKASKEDLGLPILRMNNINDAELRLNDIKYLKDDKSFERFILNKKDLLFNRTNSKELVGKTAIFNEDGKYTFASYLIRVKINESKADVRYINELFNSSILQIQKDMVSRQITGQANINAQEMQDFLFPMPSLDIQSKIASVTSKLRYSKTEKLILAEQLKYQANEEFDKAIFQ